MRVVGGEVEGKEVRWGCKRLSWVLFQNFFSFGNYGSRVRKCFGLGEVDWLGRIFFHWSRISSYFCFNFSLFNTL